eukprot:TRINITY_DN48841_c0_g1_i1.p1 TRINITY_DN48841_c0_g1~~TRINITY_DN48841_c0_g1_i1.p1  ORF type:complete len:300 (-),score=22.03 TRINITY_DN48841_c0_g1_i1:289-1188(-)
MGGACGIERNIGRRTVSATYDLGSTLGSGGFGVVREARRRDSGEHVAIKVVNVANDKGQLTRELLDKLEQEVSLMKRVQGHPHCINCFDMRHEGANCYLAMELCSSSLMQEMKSNPKDVINDFVSIIQQILSAISYCHEQLVVHRDIKPENLLFGGPQRDTLKLCDFGMARRIKEGGYLTGMFGTPPYMAPEIVCKERYTEKVDVWSAGVVAYLLSSGHYPYSSPEKGSEAIYAAIRVGKPTPSFTSDDQGALLRILMQRRDTQRCSASGALQAKIFHPGRSSRVSAQSVILTSKSEGS